MYRRHMNIEYGVPRAPRSLPRNGVNVERRFDNGIHVGIFHLQRKLCLVRESRMYVGRYRSEENPAITLLGGPAT